MLAGAVLARAGGRSVRVHAGEEAGAVCSAASQCRLLGPGIFQPGEPWSSSLTAAPRRLHALQSAPAGSTPPTSALAPAFSHVSVYRLPAAAGAPEQLAVHWSGEFRKRAGGLTEPQEGVLIWQRASPTRWRIVYRRRATDYALIEVTVGDTTGDSHSDVLLVQEQGSGACGPRVLVAWAAGRERTLVARNECESTFRLEHGALVVDEPIGPCPYRAGSVHCFGGTRHILMRWSGAQLVERRATVTCALPRLDPARACISRRR